MAQDPFYESIRKALEGKLDPDHFEDCVCDLLRDRYPTLVPVSGGNDAGMDGAIADLKGRAYGLVCTTSKAIRRNLKTSLNSSIANKLPRRKAVFATSQKITPAERRTLEVLAEKIGFTLVQVYDRTALARLLYHRPDWCKILLGLTGDPPALSEVPITRRPLIGKSLIGRRLDLKWLQQPGGNRLVVGQPGSGKTFLLYHFAKLGGGLFVNTTDREKIAQAIRALKPKALIVDDAHTQRDLLMSLRHLKTEIRADYSIIATCWPGDKEDIQSALDVPSVRASVRELQRLSRDQMVKVINHAGIQGPVAVVRELVNQADGRPGLGVTLADLCRRGCLRGVMLGESLSSNIKTVFEKLVSPQAITILAAFGIGGDAGMNLGSIAEILRMNMPDLRNIVEKLAAGGVLFDHRSSRTSGHTVPRLSVHPVSLRYALVRDVFFKGAARISVDKFLQEADFYGALDTLIGARARSGDVPSGMIEELLHRAIPDLNDGLFSQPDRARWRECAEHYASLGRRETIWVLDQDPGALISIASTALRTAPDVVIPRLLREAITDKRELNSAPSHPLRIIQDWICGDALKSEQRVSRRQAVLKSALHWLKNGNDWNVGIRAACSAFATHVSYLEADPGSGDRFWIYSGSIDEIEAKSLKDLWPELRDELRRQQPKEWIHIFDMIHQLPHGGWRPRSESVTRNMHSLARSILEDILSLVTNRAGVLSQIKNISDRLKYNLSVPVDQEFEMLFGERFTEDRQETEELKVEQTRAMAMAWSALDPAVIAQKIMGFQHEAFAMRLRSVWPRFLCEEMARIVSHPGAWASSMAAAGASHDMVYNFLWRSASMNEPNWENAATVCLNSPTAAVAAIAVVLQFGRPQSKIVEEVFADEEGLLSTIKVFRMGDAVPDKHRMRLLEHSCRRVSSAAVVSELHRGDISSLRTPLQSSLRRAIVENVEIDCSIEEALAKDPQLACDWLAARMKDDSHEVWPTNEPSINAAISVLSERQRRLLIPLIRRGHWSVMLLQGLIGGHLALYRELLADEARKQLHLLPLKEDPDGDWATSGKWAEKAKLALDAGYSARDLVNAIHGGHWSFYGKESAYWNRCAKSFEALLSHSDARIQKVGRIGGVRARNQRRRARKMERDESIYGWR